MTTLLLDEDCAAWLAATAVACSKPTNDTVVFAFLFDIGVSEDSVGDSAHRDELCAVGPGRRTRAAAIIRGWPIFG
uniref:Uncharacterized protein n=1 Tax=Oryza rufipogon TaxID=4529 RepID=A0A0E0NLC5_ORYRU